jgi:hypothetical protein
MKKLFIEKTVALKVMVEGAFERVKEKLSEKKGSFLEEAIKYIIYFVLGALLLAGLYFLFKNIILPTLQTKTQEMFNYTA